LLPQHFTPPVNVTAQVCPFDPEAMRCPCEGAAPAVDTVKTADALVVEPTRFETTTEMRAPLSAGVTAAMV